MNFRSIRYLTYEGLKNIWVNRLMTLASVGVLVACMLLMGAAALFSLNVDSAMGHLEEQNVVVVFLDIDTKDEAAQQTFSKIKATANVLSADLISKEESMKKLTDLYKSQEEKNTINELYGKDDTFLPHSITVTFEDISLYNKTLKVLSEIENVDSIKAPKGVIEQVINIRKIVTIAGAWIIGLLLITALVIISNTIKITMHSRKLEITIMKAVGATNSFVRLPFVIEGMVFGIISALVSVAILYFAYNMIIGRIPTDGFFSPLNFNDIAGWLLLAFSGIGLISGSIGSAISIGKYLRKEGSELSAF